MSATCSIVLVFTLIALSGVDEGACTVASFYGDSYIRWPMENAHSETDIKLHFRTHQSEGVLLLAAGSPDYCVVELRMGMVRVRTDLGTGEAALSSPPGIRFDDWKWHNLHLSRKQGNLRLTIDGLYTTSTQTPGKFFELNINSGIFLGGVGSFTDIFFGNLGSYRGCLRHVQFNDLDAFHGARAHFDPLNVYGVTWDCSAEFGATSDQAISFLHNTSFMALPTLPARSEGRISFDIRTKAEAALLIYNSGRLHSSDFFAVEMLHGNIKLTVNKGDGAVELMSVDKINDGLWHQIEVVVELTGARVTVDGVKEETYQSGTNRFLDLQGYLYVGGVSLQARGQAISKGLTSLSGIYGPAGSLIGCLQNIKVNGIIQGFTEAQVTRGLTAECVWTYPCLSNPCIQDAICLEEGFYTYRCVCDQDECRKHTFTENNLPPVPVNDVLAIQDVVVREGGRALITIQNIDILFDYEALGIRESSIVFRVVNPAEQGEVQVNIGRHEAQPTFTLLDMQSGKVSYLHHGSEVPVDSVGLELEFFLSSTNSSNLPHKLRQKYGFTLIIKVAPWNDKPQIMLPPDDTLIMVQNTDVRITSKLFNVVDKDDEAQNLEYTVEYPQLFDTGYFEISDSLGVRARIVSFKQEDVNEGRLKYVHRGNLQADIKLQVSDGKDISEPRILHIRGVPLELRPVANHGIVITPGGGALIFRDNLTFATNVPNQDIDIRYEVFEPPFNGEVQRMQYADNQWVTVTTFSQRHIDKSRLRYIHSYPSHHPTDYFKFRVTALSERTEVYNFTIRIIPSKVGVVNNKVLEMKGERFKRLTRANLLSNSSIPTHGQRVIKYTLASLPQHGNLYKLDSNRGHRFKKHKFVNGGNFTQEDLNDQRVMYRLHKALDNTIRDSFQFRVAIPGDTSGVQTFSIKYTPSDNDVQLINNGLTDVQEGESKVITMEELYMKSRARDVFHFSILSSPVHGVLQLIDNKTGLATNRNCTAFTSEDIRNGKVLYHHDDSENEDDSFSFLATPAITQPDVIIEIQELTGIFEIKIQLRNDNKPERVVNEVFTVVSGRGRVLTAEDILYTDKDIDFDPNEITYLWKDIQNGELVQADDKTTPVSEFKQKDLMRGKIYFKHHGANYGRAVLTVTDGSHVVKDVFEVRASEPYLMISKNSGLSVVRGEITPIKVNNLSISTNLDMDDKDVKFTIQTAPSHGRIKKNGMDKTKFHLGDLRSGQLVYEHDGSMNLQDSFTVIVRAEELRQEADVKVKIVLESHGNPPRLINSKMVMVDEKQMSYITSDALRVSHPETRDQEIIYTIDTHPQYGEIVLENGLRGQDLKMFTQADINAGRLRYIHTQLGHTSDVMTFDVTNGIQPLQDLELVFEIIPKVIPMDVANIAVEEGARIPLTANIIHITNKHFQRDELIFMIVKLPENGTIEAITSPGVPLGRFMWSQVNAEGIYYVHDGSDSMHDDFSLMAMSVTSQKKSNPQTIGVTIDPVNDQIPEVTINKVLDVWTDSLTSIGADHLKTEDNDTAPYELMYVITKPTNGDIVLLPNLQQNIANFTQAHINRGDVIFIHTGAEKGEFEFQVNDGVNKAERRKFKIHSKQLVLEMKMNEPLEVYPGIIQPITTKHLLAKTNDNNQTRPITYTMQAPLYGKLAVRRNNISVEVDTFTQQDINNGIIIYHHDGEMRGWQQNDTLEMEVSTAYAQSLRTHTFTVLISYANINENNRAQLIKVGSPMVEEGQQVTVTREYLDITPLRRRLQNSVPGTPHVSYVITELPKHGILVINGENATVGTEMSQRDVNRNNVLYMHDDSDSYWDIFKFSLNIAISGGIQGNTNGGKHKQDNIFNITIIPVNDQKFIILTENPEIKIVQEEVKTITKEALNTEDADTPPDGITYNVIEGPNNGGLAYQDAPDTKITAFTQEDINSGRVLFIPNGGPESGAFYFTVTDGQFTSPYKIFNIIVSRLTLELVNTSDIILLQGDVRQTLMPDNLLVETNGDKSKIIYNVTKPPVHGELYMNNHPVYQFSQLNVENNLVSYIQTDLSAYKDHFEFILYDSYNMILEQRMNVTVKPRVITNVPDLPLGEDLVISVDMLNAGPLAEHSASNPVYTINEPPKFGMLYKYVPPRRVRRDTRRRRKKARMMEEEEVDEEGEYETDRFTHQDIVDGHISYQQSGNLNEPAMDGFGYMLSTPNTQPAPGKFEISLVVGEDADTETAPPPAVKKVETAPIAAKPTPAPAPAPTPGDGPSIIDTDKTTPPSKQVGRDHRIILIIVCIITVIVIVGFIAGRCMRAKRKREELAAAKEDSRSPLSQPNAPVETQPPVDSPDSPSSPIPVINVTPDFEEGEPEGEQPPDRSRSPSTTPSNKSRSHSPNRYHTQPISYSRDDYRVQGSSTPPPARSPKLVHSAPMSKSQDALKTEVSKTVPTCKVTPLFDGDNYGSLGRRVSGSGTLKRGESNTGSLKRDQVTYDWDSVDPELLQHCRTTNPVLHENKYWV